MKVDQLMILLKDLDPDLEVLVDNKKLARLTIQCDVTFNKDKHVNIESIDFKEDELYDDLQLEMFGGI